MMILPEPPTRIRLQSFWALVSLAAGFGVGATLSVAAGTAAIVAGLVAGLALLMTGWLRNGMAEAAYGAWNTAARAVGRAVAFWISGILFFLMVNLAGVAGSRLPWAPRRADQSGWRERDPAEKERDYGSQHATGRGPAGEGWIRSFLAWARGSGNYWAVGLVPLLALQRLVRPKAHASLRENIYTLY